MAWESVLTDREVVAAAVQQSRTLQDALSELGLPYTQRSRDQLLIACHNYGIDCSFPLRYSTARIRDEDIFVENSSYVSNRNTLKRRFIAAFLVPEECAICGQLPAWNGVPLTLQLDHINGVNNDHRPDNLRLLCPNCHTQTPTYAGKRSRSDLLLTCALASCSREFLTKRLRKNRVNRYCSAVCAAAARRSRAA